MCVCVCVKKVEDLYTEKTFFLIARGGGEKEQKKKSREEKKGRKNFRKKRNVPSFLHAFFPYFYTHKLHIHQPTRQPQHTTSIIHALLEATSYISEHMPMRLAAAQHDPRGDTE